MDALFTVAIILAISILGSLVIHRLHQRQAGRLAAMRYGRFQPGEEGRRQSGRIRPRIRPGLVPSLRGRARRDHRDGGRGRHPARRRRNRRQ